MDDKQIGEKIKALRKSSNMTQQALANEIGRTESSIRKYEKGIVQIPLKVISQIAEVFGKTVTDIVGEDTAQEMAKASVYQTISNTLKTDPSYFSDSLLSRFGFSSYHRENDNECVYVSHNQSTYKISSKKYEALKKYISSHIEQEIINLLILLSEEGE